LKQAVITWGTTGGAGLFRHRIAVLD
jgi:hypothetical protein